MGLDLTFLIASEGAARDVTFAHSMLDCRPGKDIAAALFKVEEDKGRDVPEPFNTYLARGKGGDPCYGDTQTTPYGEKLRMVRAQDLTWALAALNLSDESKRFRAAVAYLKTLDRDNWVALYWH